MKIAVLFHRIGPYHLARLKAASHLCELYAIEFCSKDKTYAWDVIGEQVSFHRATLFSDGDVEMKSTSDIFNALKKELILSNPDVVAIPGWSGRPVFLTLMLCQKMQVPAIAMSDSTELDEVRKWWKEWIKKRVVGSYTAALVAGVRHAVYMNKLGMVAARIFSGYDVVDNSYFTEGANAAREKSGQLKAHYNLPENYFLGSNRFIAKKNLIGLVHAYAEYRNIFGPDAWKLVLLGDGELMANIHSVISELELVEDVLLPGFKQYPDLPVYYGLAKAFVHASTSEQWGLVVNEAMASGLPVLVSERCGCAPDLVKEGINGFTFNPHDIEAMAERMLHISSSACDLAAMGQASQEIIKEWSPEVFAANLCRAAEAAITAPAPRANLCDKALLWLLTHR